jgi:hypothetical protein
MRYYNSFDMPSFTGKDLNRASKILRNEIPGGPRTQSTSKPDKDYSFNDIASNIRPTLLEISKSLY